MGAVRDKLWAELYQLEREPDADRLRVVREGAKRNLNAEIDGALRNRDRNLPRLEALIESGLLRF